MRYKYLNKVKPRSFNKRFFRKYNSSLFFRYPLNLILTKQTMFEFAYFKIIKTIFKNSLKYKYTIFKKLPYFFNLLPNFPLSVKVKNSRMGKGIGKFLRWNFLLGSNTIIFSFASVFLKRFFFFLYIIRKRTFYNLSLINYNT